MNNSKKPFDKIKGTTGIYKNVNSNTYIAIKKVKGIKHQETFENISDAKEWWRLFNAKDKVASNQHKTTLKDIWNDMITYKSPRLAASTIEIWTRRYQLLKELEHLPLNQLTGRTIIRWIEKR